MFSKNQAQLDLARTVIKAPMAGRIAMKNVDPGKYVQPGQALLSIVQDDTWVVANFKETQIKKMTVGQPVKVKVDAYPGIVFKGHVDSLQSGTGCRFQPSAPGERNGQFRQGGTACSGKNSPGFPIRSGPPSLARPVPLFHQWT